MKPIRSRAAVLLFPALIAALLAACGGGDPDVPGSVRTAGAPSTKGAFSSIVVFGSSESDMGTYAPATSLAGNGSAPYFGGKFTTNDPTTGTVWVENLAASLGILVTPAEVGFAGQSVKCPAAAVAPNSCTNYAQGGARVTNPDGRGHAGGALTVPLVTQIDNHLQRFGGFKSSDLVFVIGGINDLFDQFETFAAAAQAAQAQAAADVAAGRITADQAGVQVRQAAFAAQTAAQLEMKQAAQDLARYVRGRILANGATYVAVAVLPDFANTPLGLSVPATIRPVFTDLSRVFNLWLHDGLGGQPVQVVDSFFDIFNTAVASPATYGFTNVTTPACDAAAIARLTTDPVTQQPRVTSGSALFCNATPGAPYNTLAATADPLTWLFADDVHPSTGGHRYLATAIAAQLRAYGWIE